MMDGVQNKPNSSVHSYPYLTRSSSLNELGTNHDMKPWLSPNDTSSFNKQNGITANLRELGFHLLLRN
jgi:hypothetical protein